MKTFICNQAPKKEVSSQSSLKDKRFVKRVTDIATILELHSKGMSVRVSTAEPIYDSRSYSEMLETSNSEVNKQFANPISLSKELDAQISKVQESNSQDTEK